MTRAHPRAEDATIDGGRGPQVSSEAQARLREQDAAVTADEAAEVPGWQAAEPGDDVAAEEPGGGGRRRRGGPAVPAVLILSVLLVLLLAGAGYLWFTRPAPSSVRTADYVQVLQAARSEVVDLTSFDYQTLDDDIAQAKKISVGDLQSESVKQLNDSRQQLTDQQAVVNTQVVGAAVTRADDTHGTVLMVIQSTQKTKAAAQPQVVRYRIEAQLQKTGGRWLLSGISGR